MTKAPSVKGMNQYTKAKRYVNESKVKARKYANMVSRCEKLRECKKVYEWQKVCKNEKKKKSLLILKYEFKKV